MTNFHRRSFRVPALRHACCLALCACLLCHVTAVSAQTVVGNVSGTTQGGQQGTNQGNTTNINFTTNGIYVDAEGVVKAIFPKGNTSQLDKLRKDLVAAQQGLPANLAKFSALRKVSLVQLEAACRPYVEKQENVPAEMQFLAGLQRIDYIFIVPETNDLVIAGPAEGFSFDELGRAYGNSTRRPPIRLDDLIVALRATQRTGTIGCSIDPRQDNLAEVNKYIKKLALNPATSIDQAVSRHYEMTKLLGTQDVRIFGVPAETHYAQVLLEADFRMKLISVGKEAPPLKNFRSHLAMIGAAGNSSQRFWFIPLYEPFEQTADRLAIHLAGQRAQLVTQEELVDSQGARKDTQTRLSTAKFAIQFTKRFEELAKVAPVFAEFQNLIDLAVLSAWLRKEQVLPRINWPAELFLDEERMGLVKFHVPRTVETVGNHKITGPRVIGMFGGGVQIEPWQIAEGLQFTQPSGDDLQQQQTAVQQHPRTGHWWWD